MPLHLQDKGSRTDIRVRITALFFAFKFFSRKVFAQFRLLAVLVQISCCFCNIDYSADVICIVTFPNVAKQPFTRPKVSHGSHEALLFVGVVRRCVRCALRNGSHTRVQSA